MVVSASVFVFIPLLAIAKKLFQMYDLQIFSGFGMRNLDISGKRCNIATDIGVLCIDVRMKLT